MFSALFVFGWWKMSFVFADVKSLFLEETGELVEAQEGEKSDNGRNSYTILETCKWRKW